MLKHSGSLVYGSWVNEKASLPHLSPPLSVTFWPSEALNGTFNMTRQTRQINVRISSTRHPDQTNAHPNSSSSDPQAGRSLCKSLFLLQTTTLFGSADTERFLQHLKGCQNCSFFIENKFVLVWDRSSNACIHVAHPWILGPEPLRQVLAGD